MAEDLPDSAQENAQDETTAATTYHESIRNLKKQMILNSLEQANGNMTEAAKLLGVHANYLHRLMRNLELRAKVKKQTGA
jgi:DNA-binding NtrC family response regulator